MTRIIDAEALKKALINAHINMVLTFDISTFNCVMNTIDNAPTVDTTCPHCDSGYAQGYSDGYLKGIEERPQGEWIDTGSGQECNVCHEIQYGYDNFRHFCANCGAKMEGGAE